MPHNVRMCLPCKENRHNDCDNFGFCSSCSTAASCPCWEDSHRSAKFDTHVDQALAAVTP